MKIRFWRLSVILLTGGFLFSGWFFLSRNLQGDQHCMTLRYVAADGNCGADSPCYARLQDAVDAAQDGDEIRVAAGHYAGSPTATGRCSTSISPSRSSSAAASIPSSGRRILC